ncbi:CDP-glucose 4,6-dehydratase [bacterium]|jgi:CDP-glucose 4,6-dehydratase|nr:CDP-glucose 4,6-dehydratase [bacterium]
MKTGSFGNTFYNKRVLITGHTGFKGSWLTQWLLMLGAKVTGLSDKVPTNPSLFDVLNLKDSISDIRIDITNYSSVLDEINKAAPDIVFHLAAQSIVNIGFSDPLGTFMSNAVGTMNVLEAIRVGDKPKAVVLITSDKAYKNKEWVWGYRESDELGGDDPYSASKGCAELIIQSYVKSFFKDKKGLPNIASARAGNVIGGGDWSDSRLIPDIIRSWKNNESLSIRSPESTRPWQHVLEPLRGYLELGQDLLNDSENHGESFNFGPDARLIKSVSELLESFSSYFENIKWIEKASESKNIEHGLLKLCCDKALSRLDWLPILDFEATIKYTATWYLSYYKNPESIQKFTRDQIEQYNDMCEKFDFEGRF